MGELAWQGKVLFHKLFKFADGDVGRKLLIVLNQPKKEQPILLCRTTTHQKNRPAQPGCHAGFSCFFIPANQDCFPEDTWIQLYELYEFELTSVVEDYVNGELEMKGELSAGTFKALVDCAKKVRDISEKHLKMITA